MEQGRYSRNTYSRALSLASLVLLVILPLLNTVVTVTPTYAATAHMASTTGTSQLLVQFTTTASATDIAAAVSSVNGTDVKTLSDIQTHEVNVASGTEASAIATLQANPAVVNASQEVTMQTASIPNDPGYSNQWALPKISWDGAYGTITPAGHATIAVLDTGVDAAHPDLSGVVDTSNSISEVGGNPTADPNGHGTEMAGIAAASVNNNVGMAGVDYAGASVSSVQVLGANGTGTDANVTAGVLWAADHGANVILMSIYTTGYSSALAKAISYAQGKGVLVVASTGNSASNVPTYPAGDPGVLGVTATDQNDALLSSDDLVSADVAAPGASIYATQPGNEQNGGNYGYVSGTSPAAAEAAGLAGLLIAKGDNATQAYNQITGSTDPISGQSFGRINVLKALGGPPVTVTPQPTPSTTPQPVPSPTYVSSDTNASNGDGTMSVTPTTASSGSSGNNFTFTFQAETNSGHNFNAGSQLTLKVPSGWTQPTTGTGNGHIAITNPAAPNGCSTTPTFASPAVSTGPPWTITINIAGCNGTQGFSLAYQNVTAPTTAQSYQFETMTKSGGATSPAFADIAVQPSVTVNGAAPTAPVITAPCNATSGSCSVTTNSSSVTVSGTAQTGVSVQLYDGSTAVGSPSSTGTGATWSVALTGVSDGAHAYTAKATANSQTSSASNTATVTVDTVAPSSTITFPVSGTSYRASTYTAGCGTGSTDDICGTASDGSGTGVANVKVSIKRNSDGTYWNGTTFTGTTQTFNAVTSGTTSWTYNFTRPADGSYTVQSQATDNAGNIETPGPGSTFTIDTTAPTVTVNQATGQSDPTNSLPINFTAVFSESVTGLTASGVTLSGTAGHGSATVTVTGSGTTYNIAVSGLTSDGTISAAVNAGAATDAAGNSNTASTSTDNTVTYDTTAPPVTINTKPSNPSNSSSATFTFSSTDGTATFQCQVDGGSFASCNSPFTDNGLADGSHTFTVKATDPAGNSSTVSYTWTIDTTKPASTITFPANGTSYNASSYMAGCSTPSTDDICGTASDSGTGATGVNKVEVSIKRNSDGTYWNGTTFTGTTQTWNTATGTTSWTYNFTRPADGGYTVQSRATDNATNVETPGTGNTFTIDTVAPTNLTATPAGGTYNATQSVTLSATDTGGSGVNALYYTTDGSTPTTSSTKYTSAISISSNTTLKFIAVDNAGNTSTVATQTYVVDTTAPTSAITFPVSGHTYNSTSWNAGCTTPGICGTASDTGSGVAGVTVTIFQASSNKYYDGSGFNSTNPVSLGATGTTTWSYAFPLSKMTDGSYTVTSTSTDVAGNAQTTAASSSFTIDTTAPTVTVNQASGQSDPTNSQPIHFTAVFSEPVTGFTSSKVTLGGTAGVGSATVTVTAGSGNSYDIAVSGVTSDGTVTASIAAGSVTDTAGNGNTASTSTDNQVTYDTTAPTLSVSHTANGTNGYNTSSPVTVTITASDATSGLAGAPTCKDGTTPLTLTAGSSGTWTTSVSGDATHSISCSVSDNATNTQTASDTVNIDSVAPSVSLTDPRTVAGTYVTTTTPTFSGTGGTTAESSSASADSSSVTVTIYNGTGTGGTSFQTLSASVGSGGSYTTAASDTLTLGSTYTVQTTQTDGAGNTGTSSSYTFTVAQKPSAPTIGTTTAGDGFVTVVWNPASSNGAAITSYTITPYISGTAGTSRTFNASGSPTYSCSTSCSATFNGLQNGATYTFSLHATNAIGDGPESAQSVTVTPTVGLCSGYATASLALCGVSVGNFGSVTLNGADQQTYAQLSSINVQDQQSGNTGWKVTMQASQLKCTSADGGCPAAGDTMTANRLFMAGPVAGSSVCKSGCGNGSLVTPQGSTPFAIDTGDTSGSAVKIADYSGGDASYVLVPGALDGNGNNLRLTVPASAYKTTYHTTLTVTVASGPS